MGPARCSVVGCRNNSGGLVKWKNQPCEIHDGILKNHCGCEPPYRLYCFPGSVRYLEKRKKWTCLLGRKNQDKSEWQPNEGDRVCSIHFVDGIPTEANPDPSLQLGLYTLPSEKPPRKR